jgi:ribosome-binding protein aMBF1 (putative translation factor)
MCEMCLSLAETKRYCVHDEYGTELSLCEDCANWLDQGQPDYDYAEISPIKSK